MIVQQTRLKIKRRASPLAQILTTFKQFLQQVKLISKRLSYEIIVYKATLVFSNDTKKY